MNLLILGMKTDLYLWWYCLQKEYLLPQILLCGYNLFELLAFVFLICVCSPASRSHIFYRQF